VDIIAHLVVSALLLATSVALLIFVHDQRAQDIAIIIIPLVAGYWLPTPGQQQRARHESVSTRDQSP
jgi:hypothetical protein